MRAKLVAAFAVLLSATSADAQQSPTDSSTKAQVTTPIPGIDDAKLVGSARASKLIGSNVYTGDTSIGQIEDVLVSLDRANVTALILSVGGFLGIGESYHPLPWKMLTYDIRLGGYVVDLNRDRLEGAPSYTLRESPNWDRSYTGLIDQYWMPPV